MLASALAPGAGAGAKSVIYQGMGVGRLACPLYLSSYEGLEISQSESLNQSRVFYSENYAYDQWIFGFFSAMNYSSALRNNDRPSVKATKVELLGFVRDYCFAHPTSSVNFGVQEFITSRWAALSGAAVPPPPPPAPPPTDQAAAPPPAPPPPPPEPPAAPPPDQTAAAPPAPAAAEAPTTEQPPAAVAGATPFVLVAFQPGVTEDDINVLLDAYKVSIVEGPNADGFVKLRLSEPLPPDQLDQFLDSMRSQTKIVKTAVAG